MIRLQSFLRAILFFLLPVVLQAQTWDNPDKQKVLLYKTPADSSRVKLLLELCSYYLARPEEFKPDLDSALYYAQQGKALSEALNDEKWIEESSWMISYSHFERREVVQGREAFMQVLQKYRDNGDKASEGKAWMTMAYHMFWSNSTYDEVISYFEKARSLFGQVGDTIQATDALRKIAEIHKLQGKLDESEKEALEAIGQYKAIGFRNLHYTYNLLAEISTIKGNLNNALYYGLEMIQTMEETCDSTAAHTFYYRLAMIYRELGQTEKSVEFFKKSYSRRVGENYAVACAIAKGLLKLGRSQEAMSFVQNILTTNPPVKIYDKSLMAYALGDCYYAFQQYDQAERSYLEMVEQESLLKYQNSYTSIVNFIMGQFYVKTHHYKKAGPYLKKALIFPKGTSTIHQMEETHLLLFKVDSAAGDYLSAIRHMQQFKILHDSIFNETKSRQIEELQIQYETKNKERDIKLLQNTGNLQESRLRQANLVKNLTFGGGVLLLIILGLVYNRFRLKQRSSRQLELQQIEINQTNNTLQALLDDKERLLREIHHRVKNNLQIVTSLLNSQSVFLDNDTALAAIRDSQHRIQSISLIHQKLYQSKDIALIDMPTYIRELTDYLQDSFDTGKTIRLDLQIEPVKLDVTHAVPVGLILNEAISNTIKYAFPNKKAGVIAISMCHTDDNHCTLKVADNGIGLPPGFDVDQCNSLGMSLMKGLSKQLQGNFELKNEEGLTVTVTFENQRVVKSDFSTDGEAWTA
ncbi:MAG: histidine kinase dimerization/phosphoacceptor domain -containing protein [Saprospiraceae bacterium]